MKIVETILQGTASVTDDLADGSSSIRTMRERQTENVPYIVVMCDEIDPHDTTSGQDFSQFEVRVEIISDRKYTSGSSIGAWNIAENVKTALHDYTGTVNTYDVDGIAYQGYSAQDYFTTNEVRTVVEQRYLMWVNR